MARRVLSALASLILLAACGSRLPPEVTPGETPAPDVVPVITSRDSPAVAEAASAAPASSTTAPPTASGEPVAPLAPVGSAAPSGG